MKMKREYRKPEIETAKVRAAFLQSGMTKADLARALGWVEPDVHRVNRVLGFQKDRYNGKRVPSHPRVKMTYALAEKIVKAIGCSPYDVGV